MSLQHWAWMRAREVQRLGPRFLLHHVRHWHGEPFKVPVKGVGPVTLRPRSSDAAVFVQTFGERQYELRQFPQFEAIEARVASITARGARPLVLDLGANVGASALWFSTMIPSARIVCVEPDPDNAAMCRANTAGRDVVVVEAAIGSTGGTVALQRDPGEEWGITTVRGADEGAGTVTVVTVDELLASCGAGCELLLVKIDIEGFEDDLFAANTGWVQQAAVICLEPHDWLLPGRHSSRAFQRVLGEAGFDVLISGENLIYVRADVDAGLSPGGLATSDR